MIISRLKVLLKLIKSTLKVQEIPFQISKKSKFSGAACTASPRMFELCYRVALKVHVQQHHRQLNIVNGPGQQTNFYLQISFLNSSCNRQYLSSQISLSCIMTGKMFCVVTKPWSLTLEGKR